MLQSLREKTEGKLQMLLSLRKNGLTSLFKEVRVFKVQVSFNCVTVGQGSGAFHCRGSGVSPYSCEFPWENPQQAIVMHTKAETPEL